MTLLTTTHELRPPDACGHVGDMGQRIYYESYGAGDVLLLLHGYSQSCKSWLPFVAEFLEAHQVVLIDLPGHGKSDPFSESLSIPEVARQVGRLLDAIEVTELNAVGFSFGGDVLFQMALIEPNKINSLVAVGSLGSWDINDFPDLKESFNAANVDISEFHTSSAQVEKIFEQFGNYVVRLSDHELRSIQSNVMLVLGDDDRGTPLKEVARVRRYLCQSDLWILPNVPHSAHEGSNRALFCEKVRDFFERSHEEK
ncbi:MAG: alpha/beta hydrolase [Gammaproteobacteria bacterium]|nr:alpha/beta hydrolase [Gammaproteobacteria bacterium]